MAATLFYFLAAIIIIFSVSVIILPNPIYSALSLAGTMVSLSFMYYMLNAPFIAGVQLIVYAGAVMVLFVMVLMLFDLKKEEESILGYSVSVFVKFSTSALFVILVAWAIAQSISPENAASTIMSPADQVGNIKILAKKLFTQYVFAFEALGVLLLLIAVGVVAVSRSRGGTHARD